MVQPDIFLREGIDLKQMVELSSPIVKCKMEVVNNEAFYRVLEVWKGEYNRSSFYQLISPEGYLPADSGRADLGQKIDLNGSVVIFYGPWNTIDGKFTAGSKTVLPILDNQIVYNAGVKFREKQYSVEEFKKAIMEVLKK
jgi:hypothetical protein